MEESYAIRMALNCVERCEWALAEVEGYCSAECLAKRHSSCEACEVEKLINPIRKALEAIENLP